MPDTTHEPCTAERCPIPHEDFHAFIHPAWCAQAYSTTPRPMSRGHESLLICRGPNTVTVKVEFGENAAVVELPVATFDRLVRQSREGWDHA